MKNLMFLKLIIVFTFFYTNAFGVEILVWGPHKYLRTSGSPDSYNSTFTTDPGQVRLIVKNGTKVGDDRIEDSLSSASIFVNGEQIYGPKDFNKKVYLLEAQLSLTKNNEFSIELASKPGSYLTIEIMRDVELPPDPGEAGKETLLGIDSDNDGVRDDIQRYIYMTYPNEEKVRLAMFQIARNYQDLLSEANDPEASFRNVKTLNCRRSCLNLIIRDKKKGYRILDALHAEILNIRKRTTAYIEFNNSLAGKTYTFPAIEEIKKCCLFMD